MASKRAKCRPRHVLNGLPQGHQRLRRVARTTWAVAHPSRSAHLLSANIKPCHAGSRYLATRCQGASGAVQCLLPWPAVPGRIASGAMPTDSLLYLCCTAHAVRHGIVGNVKWYDTETATPSQTGKRTAGKSPPRASDTLPLGRVIGKSGECAVGDRGKDSGREEKRK